MPYFGNKFHFWRLHWIVFWKCQMCFEETSLTANTQKHLFSNITTLLTDKYWQGQLTQTDSESSLVVNLVKTFLACSLITMQNLVVLSPTACAHVVGPKNLGAWATLSHKRGCGWPTRNMQLCNIVITPYLVALGQTVPAYVGDLKNFGGCWGQTPWDGEWWRSRNMLLHHLFYHANFGHSGSNSTSIISGRSSQKSDLWHSTCQGHLRSLELTRMDRQPMTSF